MGVYGIYTQVDDAVLEEVLSLPRSRAEDRIFEFAEVDGMPELGIGKSWDGAHFLLRGRPAKDFDRGDPLSEAIVGRELLFGEGLGKAFSRKERITHIATALKHFRPAFGGRWQSELLRAKRIYPLSGWSEEVIAQIELHYWVVLEQLTAFYEEAAIARLNVIVEID